MEETKTIQRPCDCTVLNLKTIITRRPIWLVGVHGNGTVTMVTIGQSHFNFMLAQHVFYSACREISQAWSRRLARKERNFDKKRNDITVYLL